MDVVGPRVAVGEEIQEFVKREVGPVTRANFLGGAAIATAVNKLKHRLRNLVATHQQVEIGGDETGPRIAHESEGKERTVLQNPLDITGRKPGELMFVDLFVRVGDLFIAPTMRS